MFFDFLGFLAHGLMPLPWWGYVVVALVFTHVTIACVTIFLHRAQAHRALDLHPAVSHFFRFWLWLTTGMVTKEWVAIHRKHHARVETPDDPHSPQTRGIGTVFWRGSELYRAEAKVADTIEKYGRGTPDDWIERNVYSRHSWQGVGLMLMVNFMLFGALGVTIWAVQMLWIPVTAAGVINGIGHYWGYRNFASADASKNIVPWGILIGGEELHNNHHAYGTSAKLSSRWYEFDLGWAVHPHPRRARPCRGPQGRADAQGDGIAQGDPRRGDAARDHRQPLRGRHGLRSHAQGDVRKRARAAARACDSRRFRQGAEQDAAQALAFGRHGRARCASTSMR
jgi:fatty-acid desaturase